jgi:DNA-directed RNA polymerase subunit RPC12/RpoP
LTALTCMGCWAEVRVAVPTGAAVVTCPKCEREIQVDQ